MAVFSPPQTSFPVQAFQQLLPALNKVLTTIQDDNQQVEESQHRQAIAVATAELKKAITDAKTLVDNLPGGQMLLQDQDAVIAALEKLKAQKEDHLRKFTVLHQLQKEPEPEPEETMKSPGSSRMSMQP